VPRGYMYSVVSGTHADARVFVSGNPRLLPARFIH